ncbi:hypothetical protein GGP41_002432 [Bipolaris sorokiniana]|uniref:Uncharacterized protein n=2 Tax=Cochliobolus sativus TaxID=45130 RepID=A0A8H6DXJ6_COCSA|nr:uncharacterized protein COCSADRAFT_94877 [Bipolaris sorokiniana ND90Pr]EMD62090.1 hypothetical protein COCSADRAFT_94877 [Bipolaris sorokiniana ND90Pr]KAF5850200.1 hypothetical protein GGP41_002432 [Bipolaris sorokiniana]
MSPLSVPKIFMAGGAVGFGYYLYMRQYWFPNPYKTQGVQNIEDRFSAGGASPTHTPAVASQRGTGSSTANEGRHGGPSKGPDSEYFKGNISSQQSEPVWPEKFYQQQYNNPKGK